MDVGLSSPIPKRKPKLGSTLSFCPFLAFIVVRNDLDSDNMLLVGVLLESDAVKQKKLVSAPVLLNPAESATKKKKRRFGPFRH
jgi:hypothetical protein